MIHKSNGLKDWEFRSDATRVKRREMLRFIGGTAAISLVGCVRQTSTSAEIIQPSTPTAASSDLPSCIVRPQQTEGPYFVDEGLNRSDIRADPTNDSLKPGVPLTLKFQVSQVRDRVCVPLEGAIVDIWHCDALGVYSDVAGRSFNTVGQKFLRGFQVTDSNGMVEFITVYPGCYSGRTVHVHFKIRSSAPSEYSYEFTSQIYFDDAVTDQVYALSPYNMKGSRTIRNTDDGIFRNGGEQLLLELTQDAEGYEGIFHIGLEIA